MYSILLVEDEKSIRDNLQRGVAWEQIGFYIAGDAANGEQALELMEALHPDVLLTDIKMPFMDGLELSRMARRMLPDIRIVVLSGYMEFGYAREAISIGVEEYLVKPITPMKLVRAFTGLREKLDRENRQADEIAAMMRGMRAAPGREDLTDRLSLEALRAEADRERQLWDFLQQGDASKLNAFARRCLDGTDPQALASTVYGYHFCAQTLMTCVRALEALGCEAGAIHESLRAVVGSLPDLASRGDAEAALIALLDAALRCRDQALHDSRDIVWKAERCIRERYTDPDLSMSDVAAQVGLSPSHFSYVFKKKTGQGFIKYLTELRLGEARRLLDVTDLPVGEIAARTGYSNVNYFSVVFHKAVGQSPKEYREAQKTEGKS